MLGKLFKQEFFRDRPLLFLSGLAVFSMLITVFRVLTTVEEQNFKIAVGYTQYGPDSLILGDWYTLYEFAIFAVISTLAALLITARVLKIDRSLAFTAIILQHVVLLFLFIVSNALLSASAFAA